MLKSYSYIFIVFKVYHENIYTTFWRYIASNADAPLRTNTSIIIENCSCIF